MPSEEYLELIDLRAALPQSFGQGDQSILNLLVHRLEHEGSICVERKALQVIVPASNPIELNQRFAILGDFPVVHADEACLIHWAGPKPYVDSNLPFKEPMRYFRTQGLRVGRHLSLRVANALLAIEDVVAVNKIQYKSNRIRLFKRQMAAAIRHLFNPTT